MTNNLHTVFIDSDAFIAFIKEEDSNHEIAVKLYEILSKQQVHFITSNYVVAEVATILSQRVNHATAVTFIKTLDNPENAFTTLVTNDVLEEGAKTIFIHQTSKNIGYVDCANMAIAKQEHITVFFSFDKGYRKNGFVLLEEYLSPQF